MPFPDFIDGGLLDPRKAKSARINAQNVFPGEHEPLNRNLNRQGLLGSPVSTPGSTPAFVSPQPITGGSLDFIQQLLQFLRAIQSIEMNQQEPGRGGLPF